MSNVLIVNNCGVLKKAERNVLLSLIYLKTGGAARRDYNSLKRLKWHSFQLASVRFHIKLRDRKVRQHVTLSTVSATVQVSRTVSPFSADT